MSTPQNRLLRSDVSRSGAATISLSCCNDLLYDSARDSPHRQEITDARDPHPSRETVSAGVDPQLEPEAILRVCHDIGYEWRERWLDPVTTMQVFFVQVVNGHTACTHLRHLTQVEVSASAYCQGRTRLPLEVFHRLLRAVGDDLQREPLEEGRGLRHRTFWADGSSFSMSDTSELQDHFGQPGGQRPGCGFPVAHLMALFHAGTGMVLKMLSAPCARLISPRWFSSIPS
jgi:hypothetical protein